MKKVSNETKIGVLAAISITLLIIGFNLLKGKSLFSRTQTIYAIYNNVDGLQPANNVQVNGLNIGSVTGMQVMDKNVGRILVKLSIKPGIAIPENSVVKIISADLLGTKAVRIDFGNSREYAKTGDTLSSGVEGSVTDQLAGALKPLSGKITGTLNSLDSVLADVHNVFDEKTRNNLKSSIAELNSGMKGLSRTASSADQVMANLNSITNSLKQNNDKITHILANAEKTTDAIAGADINKTLKEIGATVEKLNAVMVKLNSSSGSLGLLINDKKLYDNLQYSTQNLNRLLEDLRLNPKRYVHFSLFGGKDKTQPLPADSLYHN